MSFAALSRTGRKIRKFASDIVHNRDGIAAVEFGYLVPVMLLMLAGSVEVSRAISMDRKFSVVTSMTGDLVAREKDLGTNPNTTLSSVMGIINHVMAPHDTTTLKIAVIPVMASATDETNTFVYAPPFAHNGATVPAKCAPYTLPTGLVGKGGSVIVVESEFIYKPIFSGFLTGDLTWNDKATHSPRHSCVDFEDNNCVVSCP